jgi:methionyl-tRNA synthetase
MTAVGYGIDDPKRTRKSLRTVLARRPAPRRQRDHPLPLRLLARLPTGRKSSAAEVPKASPTAGSSSRTRTTTPRRCRSRSGNVVRTETILDAFGSLKPDLPKAEQDLFATDVLRYFLLREIPFGQDGSFSFDALYDRYNAALVNGYGNLVSRTLKMIDQYFDGYIPKVDLKEPTLQELIADLEVPFAGYHEKDIPGLIMSLCDVMASLISKYDFAGALRAFETMISTVNQMLSEQAPWKIDRSTEEGHTKVSEVLYAAVEAIRFCTILAIPVLPYATARVWSQLGLGDIEEAAKRGDLKDLKWGGLLPGTKLGPLSPIFPRADKGLIQTMIDTEERNAQEAAAAKNKTSLIDEKSPTAAEDHHPTHPGAAPRSSSLPHDNPGTHVGASAAITTERTGTPPHHEAPASAPFANAVAASEIPDTPQIAIDDFVKIDLRVAKILVAERIPKADKLLRLEVDLGYEKRQILSGIAEWYQPEELIGRNIVVIANLAPRKMRGLESHGMLLAASHGENGKPVLATFGEEIALGSRLR